VSNVYVLTRPLYATSRLDETFESIESLVPLQSMSKAIVRGIDSPGPDVDDGVPYVRIAEMTGPEGILLSNLKRTSKKIADEHPESCLVSGDIVVALRGVVGLPVRVPSEAEGANLSRGTARVSVLNEHSSEYVYWALRSPRVRKEILRFATGWKGEDLREITLKELRALRVPSLPRGKQEYVATTAEALAAAIRAATGRLVSASSLLRTFLNTAM
ncbi:MAG: hypothetical protein ABTR92_21425, partial [Candidatus Accumulibacter phosphatis]